MPTLFKRSNGVYYAIVAEANGCRKWRSTHSRVKSEALRNLINLAAQNPSDSPRHKLAEFIPELLDFVKHASSLENASVYKRALGHFLRVTGDLPLNSVSPKHVDQFKTKRSQEVSAVTLNLELRTLRAAFNIALRWSYIQANPFSRVRLCRIDEFVPAFLSVTHFKKIISDLPNDWFRQIIIVAAMTGMRRGELTHLCWDDVHLDRGIVVVQSRGDYSVKSGKRRIVPLNSTAKKVLEER
jgi:integrase